MSALPEWYEGSNFQNLENVLIDLFGALLPGVETGCWTPDDWLDAEVPDPALWFFRVPGGRVDYERSADEAVIQVMAVTPSRDESWELMDFVRAMLLPMQGDKFKLADGRTVQFHSVEEVSGPQMVTPAQQMDTRVVSALFKARVGLRQRVRYLDRLRAL